MKNKLGAQDRKNKDDSAISQQNKLFYLTSIVKSLPGSIYWKDKEGNYLGCNDSLLEMAGMDSVIGKTDFDMPWAAQAPQIRENDLNVMRVNSTVELEEYPTLADGQNTIVLTRKTPLRDEEGNVVGVIGISLNITDRKNYESNLKKTKEQTELTLKHIVANMPGHVYWKDKNGIYLGCNTLQAKSLGFNEGSELIGKSDFDLPWSTNIAALYHKNDSRIMESRSSEIIEEESQMDGKKVIVLSHKTPMCNKKGEVTGVLGISIDITDRKRTEAELKEAKDRAEAANVAKTEFLENMRHDIRTPLAGITGFASIISDEVNDPKIKEYVENLKASSDALLNLLNEILEFIEINSNKIPIYKKKFSLKHRMEEVINLYKAIAKQKNIGLAIDFDPDIPPFLIGDSVRIHRIIMELIANAFTFTSSGSIKLAAHLASSVGQNLIVKISVQDTGIGINPDKKEEIFQQFKKLSPSYKGLYKGSGLGLAIVNEFIEDLHGEIYVESVLDEGSTFTCIIPLKKALLDEAFGSEPIRTQSVTNKVDKDIDHETHTMEHKKTGIQNSILVVEDNAIAAAVAQAMLTNLDCQIDWAIDGKSATQLAYNHEYDLIFMDIGLPDIDGFEVTRRIRLQELNKGVHVPIIALTAHLDENNKQECLKSGMNAVLTKPLTKEKAQDILNAFISNRKPPHEENKEPSESIGLKDTFDEPSIDFDLAIEQMGGQTKLVNDMLTMLINSFPAEIVLFEKSYKTKDWPAVQKLAHKMKSGASYCGTVRLKTLCTQLESAIMKNQPEHYQSLYTLLIDELSRVKVEFQKHLSLG